MIRRIKLNDAEFVESLDEYGFKDIVDDFEDAEKILIVTYNLSNDHLLKRLSELPDDIDIRIFTNIPGRFPSYFSDEVRSNAEKKIHDYLDMLSPDKFGDNIHVFFAFDNHSKIVATDFSAYVGSANYSDASRNNSEAGIITHDSDFLEYLFSGYLDELYSSSVPASCHKYLELLKELCDYLNNKIEVFRELADSCYSYYDTYSGEEHRYYLGAESTLSQDVLDRVIDYEYEHRIIEKVESVARELGGIEDQLLSNWRSSLNGLVKSSNSTGLQSFINFDLNKRTWEIFHTKDSDGDDGSEVAEQSQLEAYDELSVLSEYAEGEIVEIINAIRSHREILKDIYKCFQDKIRSAEAKKIDNT